MFRIDDISAATTLPAPQAAGTPGYFQGGDDTTGLLATVVTPDWANDKQEELIYVVTQAGLALNKTDQTLLYQAIIHHISVHSGAGGTIPEAPLDANTYGRHGGAWVAVVQAGLPQPYDIAFYVPGLVGANQVVLRYTAVRPVTLPANLAGSHLSAGTASAGVTTFSVQAAQGANAGSNTFTSVGTASFAAGATQGTWTMATQLVLAAGDVLRIVAPATADTALANVAGTLAGTR